MKAIRHLTKIQTITYIDITSKDIQKWVSKIDFNSSMIGMYFLIFQKFFLFQLKTKQTETNLTLKGIVPKGEKIRKLHIINYFG